MVQVDLITGFLGAGKTTFLRRYVRYLVQQGHKVCILENDFGAVNVEPSGFNSWASRSFSKAFDSRFVIVPKKLILL